MFSCGRVIAHIIGYDIWFYWIHRILHQSFWYKTVHKIHHQIPYKQMNYTHTNIGHMFENIVQPLGICIPFFFITSDSYICTISSFSISLVFTYARGLMRHDHYFTYWFGNHHLLHHKYPNYNYGEYWLDLLFYTHYPHSHEYIHGILYT
jgi:sterol desaturase/sphingolipid hydroxylase (fatty acid hydroxylase superfamily)